MVIQKKVVRIKFQNNYINHQYASNAFKYLQFVMYYFMQM